MRTETSTQRWRHPQLRAGTAVVAMLIACSGRDASIAPDSRCDLDSSIATKTCVEPNASAEQDASTSDAFASSSDDPCPTMLNEYDCTASCLGVTLRQQACTWGCGDAGLYSIPLDSDHLPLAIRVRSSFAGETACRTQCGEGTAVPYGVLIDASRIPDADRARLRVRVGAPFLIAKDTYQPRCIEAPGAGCLVLDQGEHAVYVYVPSSDVSAVTRNITVDWVPEGGVACP